MKTFALALAGLLAAVSLSACGNGANNAATMDNTAAPPADNSAMGSSAPTMDNSTSGTMGNEAMGNSTAGTMDNSTSGTMGNSATGTNSGGGSSGY